MIVFSMTGNLGNDAVMTEANGKKVINFNVCHSESWKTKEGERSSKQYWVDCDYFSEDEILLKMLTKGSLVHVSGGKVESRIHFRKSDNAPMPIQYLKVSKVEILNQK